MIRAVVLALALIGPMPALALSCLAPDVVRSYERFDEAEARYVVIHGRLTFDRGMMPRRPGATGLPPEQTDVPARLKGLSLTAEGFTVPYDQALTLSVRCLSRWCGAVENGADVLAFVRKEADGYTLDLPPCGGTVFAPVRPEQIKAVQGCAKGRCPKP